MGLTGCDTGPAAHFHAPPVLVNHSLLAQSTGVFLANKNAPVELWFDQLLSPRSVVRANFSLRSADLGVNLRLRWEPASKRVSVLFDAADVREDVEYTLVVRETLLSWDGVAAGRVSAFRVRFFAGEVAMARSQISFAREVQPFFAASCAVAGCHSQSDAVMDLDLSSAAGVQRSVVGVISRQNPSMLGGPDRTEPQWSGMPRVLPGEPEQSYLLYKLLGDGPLRGSPMPFGGPSVPQDQIEKMSLWIAQGARTDN